jgi:signal transduction histidine kinase
MAVEYRPTESNVHKAATAEFNFHNPAEALGNLLQLTVDILPSLRAALYEYDDQLPSLRAALYEYDDQIAGFMPRFAFGIPLKQLGHLGSSSEHPILQAALTQQRAISTGEIHGSLGLPLAPGTVACAPCISSGKTIGLIFIANDDPNPFNRDALATLEVLATRAADILAFAKQTASQNYLFHRLSLLYQASHAITGTRNRQEAIKQTVIHSNIRDYPIHHQVLKDLQPVTLSLLPPKGSHDDLAILEEEGLAAVAIFPLATGNQALGFVRLLFTQPDRKIREQEMELAQAIINIGAVGIQDAIHLETAEDRAEQLEALADIGREMTSSLDLEVALENTMKHTQRILQCEAAVLFLLDESGEKLVLKASGGRDMRIRDVAIRLEEGIAGWVTRNKRPLIVNDVRSNPLYHSAIDKQTGLLTSSILCVPLTSRGEALGVIEAINHPRGSFTESDQRMIHSVASWAAIALDNSNLFRRVTDERTRLETTLVETADSVVLTDSTGNIILVNQAAGQAFRINAELATGRPASEIFANHPLGDMLISDEISLPTTTEITTPTDRVLYATISEVTDVGRVAVMQDITGLKQIDRMRSQLLGTAAHDLKNPLNAIRLGADLLQDAQLSEQQRKALKMMQRATDSMTNLITGLLETIRVETSANLLYEPCDLNELILFTIDDLRPLADAQKHSIVYEPPSEPMTIMADVSRIGSVINNLLSNAIKFTEDGGNIEIAIDWDDECITVSVKDDGPGIPEDEVSRIFEHLFRGRVTVRDPNNPIDGTGLGLALSKTVIEQHGGSIWVETSEPEGSTFFFTLPEPMPKTGSLKQDTDKLEE